MNEHRRDHAITLMCRVLRVARAGFYAWLHEPLSDHAREDARLLELIRASYSASHGVYGARRIFGDLREARQFAIWISTRTWPTVTISCGMGGSFRRGSTAASSQPAMISARPRRNWGVPLPVCFASYSL